MPTVLLIAGSDSFCSTAKEKNSTAVTEMWINNLKLRNISFIITLTRAFVTKLSFKIMFVLI